MTYPINHVINQSIAERISTPGEESAKQIEALRQRVLCQDQYPSVIAVERGFCFGCLTDVERISGSVTIDKESGETRLDLFAPIPNAGCKIWFLFVIGQQGVRITLEIAEKASDGFQLEGEYNPDGSINCVHPSIIDTHDWQYAPMHRAGLPTREELPEVIDPVATIEAALRLIAESKTTGNLAWQRVPPLIPLTS